MQTGPLVSVVMAMFNAERFLEQAVRSILDQTYGNFEFIIVDDGSKDRSWEMVTRLGQADTRIRLIRLERNQGVSTACNAGLEIAKGKYIARMDSDDISLPGRLLQQVEFMEGHPEVGVVGSGMRYMDERGSLLFTPPVFQTDLAIHWYFLFESPFFNPTVMIRKSTLDRNDLRYDPMSVHGEEDYELWSRLLPLTGGANLPEILLYYRLHPHSITHRHQQVEIKRESVVRIAANAIQSYLPGLRIPLPVLVDLQRAVWGGSRLDRQRRSHLLPVYLRIWDEFCNKHAGDSGLADLGKDVMAWAARMALYPPFQPGVVRSLDYLTARNWKWPLYLISKVPYFIARRRIR